MKRMRTKKEISEVAVDSVSEAIESGEIELSGGVKQLELIIPAHAITKVGQQWNTTKEYADKWATIGGSPVILAVYFGFGGYSGNTALFSYRPEDKRLRVCNPSFTVSNYGATIDTDGALDIDYTPNHLSLVGCNDEYSSMDDVIADDEFTYIKVLYI